MPEPVLVIHGIAVRDEGKYIRAVADLNAKLGDRWQLIPIYWGDLGASAANIEATLLRHPEQGAHFRDVVGESLSTTLNSGIVDRTAYWKARLKGKADKATSLRKRIDERDQHRDTSLEAYLNKKFQKMRAKMMGAMLPFIADVIVYQSVALRAAIHQRVRETITRELGCEAGTPSQPVQLIAHSLGGVITFDMAMCCDQPLHIDRFVTFGSQPGFFHVLDPRSNDLPPYVGEPVTMKATIQRWTNVWDIYDLIAFGVSDVFRLHDGSVPRERPIRCHHSPLTGAAMLQSHLSYWSHDASVAAIREGLMT